MATTLGVPPVDPRNRRYFRRRQLMSKFKRRRASSSKQQHQEKVDQEQDKQVLTRVAVAVSDCGTKLADVPLVAVSGELVAYFGVCGFRVEEPMTQSLVHPWDTGRRKSLPSFYGIHALGNGTYRIVCGWERSKVYYRLARGKGGPAEDVPEEVMAVAPLGSAVIHNGHFWWPARRGGVVSLCFETGAWTHIACPAGNVLWVQALFSWRGELYYSGYCGAQGETRVWKLKVSQEGGSQHEEKLYSWEEEAVLPSRPCDAPGDLVLQPQDKCVEIVFVAPWTTRPASGSASGKVAGSSVHSGVLAYHHACKKWWWMSLCLHQWQGMLVNTSPATVFNRYETVRILKRKRSSDEEKQGDSEQVKRPRA